MGHNSDDYMTYEEWSRQQEWEAYPENRMDEESARIEKEFQEYCDSIERANPGCTGMA